jgi:hypothetical protein
MAVKRLRLEDAIEEVGKTKGGREYNFKPGHEKIGGREKGTKNKVSVLLKEAIMMAAEAEGLDRKGKDGVVGFLRMLSRREPAVFGRLMEKLLPYQLTGKDGSPMQVVHSTKEQLLERMKERGLPVPPSLMDMPVHSAVKN